MGGCGASGAAQSVPHRAGSKSAAEHDQLAAPVPRPVVLKLVLQKKTLVLLTMHTLSV